jgi:hypothetical protein
MSGVPKIAIAVGHQGKTRKGFGRVDLYEVIKSENCLSCGQRLTLAKSIKVEKNSVLKDKLRDRRESFRANGIPLRI